MIDAWVATLGGVGFWPVTPGTWGSLVALPSGAGLVWAGGTRLLAVGTAAASLTGWWAASIYTERTGLADPPEVVIDELTGLWLVLLAASLRWQQVAAAFVLFSMADIIKPWPASWADRQLHGGFGIMADDLLAALYAALVLWLLKRGDVL